MFEGEDQCGACSRQGDGSPWSLHVHATMCKKGGWVTKRHDRLVRVLELCCKEAGELCYREPRGVFQAFGRGGPDLEMYEDECAAAKLGDVVVSSVYAADVAQRAAMDNGYANGRATRSKMSDEGKKASEEGYELIPLAFEAEGAMSGSVIGLVSRWSAKARVLLTRTEEDEEDQLVSSSYERMSWATTSLKQS